MGFSDRLATARRRFFVGRAAELELFRQVLLAEEAPLAVLHIFGPGGVGKTTLLGEYARLAAEHSRSVYRLDGRDVDLSPQGFLLALSQAIDPDAPPLSLKELAELPPTVLLLDTYERLTALDGWLRETFLPALPAHVLVVIAGRQPPSEPWRTDPAWRELARVVSLRNLRPEESRQLLTTLKVPASLQESIVDLTYGHPLALVLLADWLGLRATTEGAIRLEQAPGVIAPLVERFVRDAPTPRHRQALEVCAHARVTTEALLAAVLGQEDAGDLFRWLHSLSFIERSPQGLFPHDLVRDVLEADLRWRNPEVYREMHRRVRQYLQQRYNDSQGVEQQRAFLDILYLHKYLVLQSRYEFKEAGDAYIESATPESHAAILQMVERHEGKQSAACAAYWLERQPHGFEVFRATGQAILGFVAHLTLHTVTPEDERHDPALVGLWHYVRSSNPLRAGESLLVTRFWMGRETYQDVFIHTLAAASAVRRWLSTPNLAWSFPCMADPDYWADMFAYLNFRLIPEAEFTVGDRRIGVFGHDWRVEPQSIWLERLAERELQEGFRPEPPTSPPGPELLVLSQPAFADAVRQALRDYHRPDALVRNPLLRSRMVRDVAGPNPGPEALKSLLRDAAATLTTTPRDENFYRALDLTFFRPAPTQEAAAERLGLPFNTYRYHLNKGIARVSEWLWQRELHGPGG